MFDDLEHTKEELIEHIEAACKALDFFRSHCVSDVIDSRKLEEEWSKHWNALNRARVDIQTAGEYLHDDLNYYHDAIAEAWADERERKNKEEKKAAKASQKKKA